MPQPPPPIAYDVPTTPKSAERIVAIDVLRGVAMLGIPVMNIQSFAMPVSAYSYPWSWGDMSGINGAVFYLSYVIASGKFISIFAMLFGAGILLQQERIGNDSLSAQIHFRRMFVLLAFGMAHAYLLWYGDILFSYAVIGMVVFAFRSRPIRELAAVAFTFFVAGLAMNLLIGAGEYAFGSGTDNELNPNRINQLAEVAAYRGSWRAQFNQRFPVAIISQTNIFFTYCLPFVSALMLGGMALMKSGFFNGTWPRKRYFILAIAGTLLGWSLAALNLWIDWLTGRQPTLSVELLAHLNTVAMVPTALGYSSAVILLVHSRLAAYLGPLAAVGRTALSCYLLETILSTFLFYGFGLGWFGSVDRLGQIGIVPILWIVILLFASLWRRFFRFGPAEWVWRAMTYGTASIK